MLYHLLEQDVSLSRVPIFGIGVHDKLQRVVRTKELLVTLGLEIDPGAPIRESTEMRQKHPWGEDVESHIMREFRKT